MKKALCKSNGAHFGGSCRTVRCLVSPAHAGRKGNPKDTKARSKLNIETYGRENANHATSNVGANPAPG